MKKKAVPEDLQDKKREYIHMLEMDHQAFVSRRVSKQVVIGEAGTLPPKKKIRQPDARPSEDGCCFSFFRRSNRA